MALNSKVDLCNLALSNLGNYGTVTDIDIPTDDKERTFALWYDICREFVLKLLMPNCALKRDIVSKSTETPSFGFSYFYEYPNQALKILGVGNIQDKTNDYNIELTPNGIKAIAHDYDYTDGMPIRFIFSLTDVNTMSPEVKLLISEYLAAYTCQAITQDVAKSEKLKASLPARLGEASSLNAQENRPIRISNSRFKASRYNSNPNFESKK